MPPRTIVLPVGASLEAATEAVLIGREEGEGVVCPCCSQQATVYARRITSTMARGLALFYRHAREQGDAWLNFPEYTRANNMGTLGQGGDWMKLTLWSLLERREAHREDGSNRVGDARITPIGRRFCTRRATVTKIAHVYNGVVLRFSGPEVTIDDALGRKFRYDEIFAGLIHETEEQAPGPVDPNDPFLNEPDALHI